MSENMSQETSKRVLLTGFGKFHGVEDNPTKKIIEYLKANQSSELCFDGVCFTLDVLEVSVDGVKDQIDYSGDASSCYDMYIHLGVDSGSQKIKLEECAYNNMSFRCEDERGYSPMEVAINESCTLDEPLKTAFDVHQICENLQESGIVSQQELTTSQDPGRFLCNYVYYRSLTHKSALCQTRNALFIHVPSEEVIPLQRQVQIIQEILKALIQHI